MHIVETPEEFIECAEKELEKSEKHTWLQQVDAFLEHDSWDNTWASMAALMRHRLKTKTAPSKSDPTKAALSTTVIPVAAVV